MMELDDWKQAWAAHDDKLDETIRLNRAILRTAQLDEVRSPLNRVRWLLGLHIAAWAVCLVVNGNFLYEHLRTLRFAVPHACVQVYAIAMVASLVRQLVMASGIEPGQPVTQMQRRLEELRVLKIRTTQWAVLAGGAMWAPFLIVALKGLFGVDAYQVLSLQWIAANLLFGLAVVAAFLWVSKRYCDRMEQSPLLQQLSRDVAGYNLNAARESLARLREFEAEGV